MSQFSLLARWVLPVDRPPLAGGVVSVAEGRIVAVGDRRSALGPLQDLGDVVLLPGLVNAHTHLEFSNLTQPLGTAGMLLPEWIGLVIAHRNQRNQDTAHAIQQGLVESLQHGVTTLGEITTSSSSTNEPPIRVVAFLEAIGFSAARTESVFNELKQRLEDSRDSTNRRSPGISPHAPYTVHPQLLEQLVALAEERRLPIAMHLAESPEELRLLATSDGPFYELLEQRSMWDPSAIPWGSAPRDYLEVLARAPRSLVIHGNYLTSDEIRFVAERADRMSIVYCPRTHSYFGHDRYRLEEILESGGRVAFGTDSRASTPDLSLLAEMRAAAQKHPTVSPSEILKIGTLGGAEALGVSTTTGSITPGKWADLITIACGSSDDDPVATILQGVTRPQTTWLRGEVVLP